MTALSAARPEDLLRLASVLGDCGGRLDELGARSRRALQVPWRGPAAQAFHSRLADVDTRLERLAPTLDSAAAVLVRYAVALEHARELAVAADRLDATASDAAVDALLLGPADVTVPLPEDLALVHERARLWRQEAERVEADAATVAAAVLGSLTDACPTSGRGDGWRRASSDVGDSLAAQTDATLALAGSALSSLPYVGDPASRAAARDDLGAAALSTVQVWRPVEELVHDVGDGRAGLAAGVVIGLRLPGGKTGPGRLFQGELDLAEHEAMGGHLLDRHVGKSLEYLQQRLDAEAGAWRSTFLDRSEARAAVAGVLAESQNQARLTSFLRHSKSKSLELRSTADHGLGLVLNRDGSRTTGHQIVVRLRRDAQGVCYIVTAYVEPRGAD